MASVNKVILIGRLGKNPELRHTPSGSAVTTLSLATSEAWGEGTNRQERIEWHRVTVWGKSAENCVKYLAKGRPVYVEGRLQTNKREVNGETRYETQIIGQNVQFLPSGQREQGPSEPPESSGKDDFGSLDDMPF